jgi:CysZ protein
MLLSALYKAFSSLFNPALVRLMLLCIVMDAIVLLLIISGGIYGLHHLSFDSAYVPHWLLDTVGTVGAIVLAWFLFPVLLPVIASFWSEQLARRVEQEDYPHFTPHPSPPFVKELGYDLRFTAKALLLNLLCLPLYLIPVVNIIIYYSLNAYLLGREFFEIAARRHMSPEAARTLRLSHHGLVMAAGLLITFAANLPVINLIVPFIAMSLMIHLMHQLRK